MENTIKNQELDVALSQFFKILYVDFGINKLNDKIKKWYELSWEEFKQELERQSVKWNDCLVQDWKDFFHNHKNKVLNLLK